MGVLTAIDLVPDACSVFLGDVEELKSNEGEMELQVEALGSQGKGVQLQAGALVSQEREVADHP